MESLSAFASVPELVPHRAREQRDHVAVSYEGETCTFGELDSRAASVQTWLGEQGVVRGDRVVIFMRNSLELLYVWLGIARAGVVGVPLNTSSLGDALAHPLVHSASVGMFADADLLETARQIEEVPESMRFVATGSQEGNDDIDVASVLATAADRVEPVVIAGSDAMNIIYTSGTTGMPKGVVLSHTRNVNTGAYFAHHLGLREDDTLQTCLPPFHCNAQQTTVMAGLSLGAQIVVNGKFSLSRFPTWIAEIGATVTNLIGSMLALLSKTAPTPADAASSFRYIVAAPVPEALQLELEDRYRARIVEGYGLTETGTMACMNPPDDRRPGTFGVPLEHTELRVVDEFRVDLGPGVPRELLVRSRIQDAFMAGYFLEPEKTAKAVQDGWFSTGDVCVRREDGYYVFIDRLKDAIRRRGENISSFLVEKAIGEHPNVLEVAATGVPSELSEQDVLVVVVSRPESGLTPEDIFARATVKLGDFMRPRYVEIRDDLPRTETGRVHKLSLRHERHDGAWDAESLSGDRA